MAQEIIRGTFPAIAASNISAKTAVRLGGGQRQVIPVASLNLEPFGISKAADASQGDALAVYDFGNTVKVVAGASLGPGADVGVASTNGALGPVAGASGSVVHRVGKSAEGAVAGQVFALYVHPRQLSGLV